jgi:hypothetical protein
MRSPTRSASPSFNPLSCGQYFSTVPPRPTPPPLVSIRCHAASTSALYLRLGVNGEGFNPLSCGQYFSTVRSDYIRMALSFNPLSCGQYFSTIALTAFGMPNVLSSVSIRCHAASTSAPSFLEPVLDHVSIRCHAASTSAQFFCFGWWLPCFNPLSCGQYFSTNQRFSKPFGVLVSIRCHAASTSAHRLPGDGAGHPGRRFQSAVMRPVLQHSRPPSSERLARFQSAVMRPVLQHFLESHTRSAMCFNPLSCGQYFSTLGLSGSFPTTVSIRCHAASTSAPKAAPGRRATTVSIRCHAASTSAPAILRLGSFPEHLFQSAVMRPVLQHFPRLGWWRLSRFNPLSCGQYFSTYTL